MPGVARDEALLEIDGVLEQPLDDEEEPLDLDGADEGGREGEVLGLVVKELLGSRAYLAQRSAAAHLPQAVHFKGCRPVVSLLGGSETPSTDVFSVGLSAEIVYTFLREHAFPRGSCSMNGRSSHPRAR